jgi:hypothetical protein
VIGEYERAFYGNQYTLMAPLFEHYGVGLWMLEVGGRVDWHAEDDEQTMLALGLSSKREITKDQDPVPLEYSIACLICSVTCGLEAAMVGWPGAAQDRLLAGSPGTRLCCPGCFPQGPDQGC